MVTVGAAAAAGEATPNSPAPTRTATTPARITHARRCVFTPTPLPNAALRANLARQAPQVTMPCPQAVPRPRAAVRARLSNRIVLSWPRVVPIRTQYRRPWRLSTRGTSLRQKACETPSGRCSRPYVLLHLAVRLRCEFLRTVQFNVSPDPGTRVAPLRTSWRPTRPPSSGWQPGAWAGPMPSQVEPCGRAASGPTSRRTCRAGRRASSAARVTRRAIARWRAARKLPPIRHVRRATRRCSANARPTGSPTSAAALGGGSGRMSPCEAAHDREKQPQLLFAAETWLSVVGVGSRRLQLQFAGSCRVRSSRRHHHDHPARRHSSIDPRSRSAVCESPIVTGPL